MQIGFFDKQALGLNWEKKEGVKHGQVVGLDEVGRGALAGPVVAAAVHIDLFEWGTKIPEELKIVRDSKQLSPNQRERVVRALGQQRGVYFALGIVSEKTIDQINILEATKQAMVKAVESLPLKPGLVLLDGNFSLPINSKQISVIKGDQKIFSIALASILAKVARDKIMINYHRDYPRYHFDRHKGYGTLRHRQAIGLYGPCPVHRLSFRLGPLGKNINI